MQNGRNRCWQTRKTRHILPWHANNFTLNILLVYTATLNVVLFIEKNNDSRKAKMADKTAKHDSCVKLCFFLISPDYILRHPLLLTFKMFNLCRNPLCGVRFIASRKPPGEIYRHQLARGAYALEFCR